MKLIDDSLLENIKMVWQRLVHAFKNMFAKVMEFIRQLFKITNNQKYKNEFHHKKNYLSYRPKVNVKYQNLFKPKHQHCIRSNC